MNYIVIEGNIGVKIPLDDSVVIPLTKTATDLNNIAGRKGTYSKTILLKGTKETNKILGHLYDVNIVESTFNREVKISASVIQDDIPVIEGYIKLLKINKSSESFNSLDQTITWEVVIYDEVSTFFQKLDGNLNDFDYNNDDNSHLFTYNNIIFSQTNDADTEGYIYLFPRAIQDPEQRYGVNFGSGQQEGTMIYSMAQFAPSLYAKVYFDKIIEQAGYTYEWDGMESRGVEFSKLIVPCTNTELLDPDVGWFPDTITNTNTSNGGYPDVKPLIQYGWRVNLNAFIPDYSQRDFIKGIFTMFNLYITFDNDNPTHIIIKSRDSYYRNGDVKDFTKKILKNKPINIEFLSDKTKKTQKFTFTKGDDLVNKTYQELTDDVAGSRAINFTNQHQQGVETITCPFTPSQNTRIPLSYNTSTNQYVDYFYPSHPSHYFGEGRKGIRMLYHTGVHTLANTSSGTFSIYIFNIAIDPSTFYDLFALLAVSPVPQVRIFTNNTTPAFGYALASSQTSLRNIEGKFDYNFGQSMFYPYEGYNKIENNTYNNLYDVHYSNQMNQIINGKIMTAYFNLSALDFYNLKPSDRLWINDSYWNFKDITDYNANVNKPTKITLISADPLLNNAATPTTLGNIVRDGLRMANDANVINRTNEAIKYNSMDGTPTNVSMLGFGNKFNSSSANVMVVGNNNNLEKATNSIVIGSNQIVEGEGQLVVEHLTITESVKFFDKRSYDVTLTKKTYEELSEKPYLITPETLGVGIDEAYIIDSIRLEVDSNVLLGDGYTLDVYQETNKLANLYFNRIDGRILSIPNVKFVSEKLSKDYILLNEDLVISSTDNISGYIGDVIKLKLNYTIFKLN